MKNATAKNIIRMIRKRIVPILLILAALALAVYIYVGRQYRGYFLPGTVINGMDVGDHTLEELEAVLKKQVSSRALDVKFPEGVTERINARDIDLQYLDDDSLEAFVAGQNYMTWAAGLLGWTRTYDYEPTISYDYGKLLQLLKTWPELNEDRVTAPEDAYIRFGEDHFLEIVPEVMGNQIDPEVLKSLVKNAIETIAGTLDLSGEEHIYLKPQVYSDDPELTECVETANAFLQTTVKFLMSDGSEEILDAATTGSWLFRDEKGIYRINEQIIANKAGAYIAELAKKDDNYGNYRAFFSTNYGVIRFDSDGMHGHTLDQPAMTEKLKQDLLTQTSAEHAMQYSTFVDENDNRLGGTYIEIDIDAQMVYYYRDKELAYSTPCVTGLNNATPLGIYEVEQRWHDTILEGPPKEDGSGQPTYSAHVDYFVQFYPSFGLHDADWRASWEFGGDTYLYDGSHGCVNLPYEAAEYFYYEAADGTPVIVFSESRMRNED